MYFQSQNHGKTIPVTIDSTNEEIEFKPCWPIHIYPCQKGHSYGAMINVPPQYSANNTETLWKLSTLMLSIDTLWKVITGVNFRDGDWYGWMLVYLSKCALRT